MEKHRANLVCSICSKGNIRSNDVKRHMKLVQSDKEPANIRNELTTNRMVCENNPLPI
jgi:hypothetical protein